MYCPKCGGQNSDDLAYCRECGENLKIISQVMKGHAPVAIASKLDSIIENKDERLRWNAVWFGISGVSYAIVAYFASVLEPSISGLLMVISAVMALLLMLYSGQTYLSYRRALELRAVPIDAHDPKTLTTIGAENENVIVG